MFQGAIIDPMVRRTAVNIARVQYNHLTCTHSELHYLMLMLKASIIIMTYTHRIIEYGQAARESIELHRRITTTTA